MVETIAKFVIDLLGLNKKEARLMPYLDKKGIITGRRLRRDVPTARSQLAVYCLLYKLNENYCFKKIIMLVLPIDIRTQKSLEKMNSIFLNFSLSIHGLGIVTKPRLPIPYALNKAISS
ncbi:hypothetical protein BpHYR1_012078 [Brachionus plicatilis]|uniref:Uncharacterized protein n=1 Tax=Brachionus plicatilis TaxID=10195 RepID=A0A3M7SS72_BRAPC|nr:hypothetical protein BpHYR1_012078 [Brachionus plicatilis]